ILVLQRVRDARVAGDAGSQGDAVPGECGRSGANGRQQGAALILFSQAFADVWRTRQAFRTWGPTRQNHDVEVEAYRLQASVRQHATPTAAGYGSYSVEARDGDVNTRTSQYVDHDGGLHFFRTWSQNHE